MHVSVNDSRHDDGIADIGDIFCITDVIVRRDTIDAAIGDMNGRGTHSIWRDHTPAANDFQAVSAQNLRKRFIDTRRR
jgi:hypothetical protein